MMDVFFFLATLGGLLMTVFWRGRRRQGLFLLVAGFIGFAVAVPSVETNSAPASSTAIVATATPAPATSPPVPPASATAAVEAPPSPPEPTPEEVAVAAARAEREAREQRYGHHCLWPFTGELPEFVTAVRHELVDNPNSFDHVETTTWPKRPDGRNQILMQFTAENALGATVRARAVGTFDNASCGDVEIEFIE